MLDADLHEGRTEAAIAAAEASRSPAATGRAAFGGVDSFEGIRPLIRATKGRGEARNFSV